MTELEVLCGIIKTSMGYYDVLIFICHDRSPVSSSNYLSIALCIVMLVIPIIWLMLYDVEDWQHD